MEGAVDRRKEIIDRCLKKFIDKGLAGTTTRDLSSAMNLQSGALYYYFASKDEAVIACAEEAAIRLENNIIVPALKDTSDPKKMLDGIRQRANKMAPTMKFLAQVCATPKYRISMDSALTRLSLRYRYYAKKFGEAYGCDTDSIEPYVYIAITAVVNYMIFEEETYIEPQLNYVFKKIEELPKNHEHKGVSNEN